MEAVRAANEQSRGQLGLLIWPFESHRLELGLLVFVTIRLERVSQHSPAFCHPLTVMMSEHQYMIHVPFPQVRCEAGTGSVSFRGLE